MNGIVTRNKVKLDAEPKSKRNIEWKASVTRLEDSRHLCHIHSIVIIEWTWTVHFLLVRYKKKFVFSKILDCSQRSFGMCISSQAHYRIGMNRYKTQATVKDLV